MSLLTAGWALARLGRAAAGETAIIHAAGGGLGTTAVQVAKQLGLTVVATASTEDRRARAAALGADVVCGYDDFDVAVRRVTGDRGADIVLDGVGGDVTRRSMSVLRPFGRLVVVGAASGEAPRLDPIKMIHSSVTVIGFHLRGLWRQPEVAREAVTEWLTWVASGAVQPQSTPSCHSTRCASPMSGSPVAAPSGRSSSRPDAGIGAWCGRRASVTLAFVSSGRGCARGVGRATGSAAWSRRGGGSGAGR